MHSLNHYFSCLLAEFKWIVFNDIWHWLWLTGAEAAADLVDSANPLSALMHTTSDQTAFQWGHNCYKHSALIMHQKYTINSSLPPVSVFITHTLCLPRRNVQEGNLLWTYSVWTAKFPLKGVVSLCDGCENRCAIILSGRVNSGQINVRWDGKGALLHKQPQWRVNAERGIWLLLPITFSYKWHMYTHTQQKHTVCANLTRMKTLEEWESCQCLTFGLSFESLSSLHAVSCGLTGGLCSFSDDLMGTSVVHVALTFINLLADRFIISFVWSFFMGCSCSKNFLWNWKSINQMPNIIVFP